MLYVLESHSAVVCDVDHFVAEANIGAGDDEDDGGHQSEQEEKPTRLTWIEYNHSLARVVWIDEARIDGWKKGMKK